MRIALGGLKWRHQDFWDATLTELFQAIHGANEANGAEDKPAAPTKSEMAALVQRYGG